MSDVYRREWSPSVSSSPSYGARVAAVTLVGMIATYVVAGLPSCQREPSPCVDSVRVIRPFDDDTYACEPPARLVVNRAAAPEPDFAICQCPTHHVLRDAGAP